MELTDIMPKEKWVELQKDLCERFGLNADVVDKDGKKFAGVAWGNELCRTLHDDKKGFSSICAPAGAMFTQLAQAGDTFAEECDACKTRLSVPIYNGDELVGAVGGCGLLAEGEEVDGFTIGMMSDLEEGKIEELTETVKVASEDRIKEIQDYIRKKIDEAMA